MLPAAEAKEGGTIVRHVLAFFGLLAENCCGTNRGGQYLYMRHTASHLCAELVTGKVDEAMA